MKLYIKTFGCQMNDRDSEALLGLFLQRGYSLAATPEEADVILVNTCSVREHAEDRAISFLGTLKRLAFSGKRLVQKNIKESLNANPYPLFVKPVIGLIGCMAKSRGQELLKRMPHIDLICSPASFDKIPEYIEKISDFRFQISDSRKRVKIIDLEDRLRNEDFYRTTFRSDESSVQVVISTGCSNYCSYCVVPYVRGQLRLRNPQDIIDEVRRNVELGIKKITLLGQNVNDYQYKSQVHKVTESAENLLSAIRYPLSSEVRNTQYTIRTTNITFIDLLKMVEEIEGVEEIDFVTSHPRNTSIELFKVMAQSPKIRKHLHLPFQSGSDRILALMNRGYTQAEYLKLVEDYKSIVGGTLSTDVIVGFPTETDNDFLKTKEVLEKARFRYAYIFKYSPRPGTKASELVDNVPQEVKWRRHKVLLDLQKKIAREFYGV